MILQLMVLKQPTCLAHFLGWLSTLDTSEIFWFEFSEQIIQGPVVLPGSFVLDFAELCLQGS